MPRLDEKKGAGTATLQLKFAACQLFAERGVDGVTVREIADAAGQKNHASVGYHFGSKHDLIRELVLDGAKVIDEQRNAGLDAIESEGGPRSPREIISLIINSAINLPPDIPPPYLRFVFMLALTHRDLLMAILGGRWNSGYLRCLEHLRQMMPDMPQATKNQRLVFAGTLIGGALAARQNDLLHPDRPHPSWQGAEALDHLAVAAEAMVMAPAPEAGSA